MTKQSTTTVEAAGRITSATTGERVRVGHNVMSDLGDEMRSFGLNGRAHVITDRTVAALHGERLLDVLARAGFDPDVHAVPAAESSKSLAQATELYDWLLDRQVERGDAIVALGGGVVGDLAGFVAATYLRGLPLIQVPTTVLAQVDSAIGGKTGVNLKRGKNLVGAFYPAQLTYMDTSTLATLPRREVASGWAEAIKYGFILDPDLLSTMEECASQLLALEPSVTVSVIERSARHKVRIVTEDPREQGIRIILNFGHTLGHAIEAATDYGRFLHGEAVAVGMIGAARVAEMTGASTAAVTDRLMAVVEQFGLPTGAPGVDPGELIAATARDKKVEARAIRWVLVEEPGRTRISREVPREVVAEVVRALVDRPGVESP